MFCTHPPRRDEHAHAAAVALVAVRAGILRPGIYYHLVDEQLDGIAPDTSQQNAGLRGKGRRSPYAKKHGCPGVLIAMFP